MRKYILWDYVSQGYYLTTWLISQLGYHDRRIVRPRKARFPSYTKHARISRNLSSGCTRPEEQWREKNGSRWCVTSYRMDLTLTLGFRMGFPGTISSCFHRRGENRRRWCMFHLCHRHQELTKKAIDVSSTIIWQIPGVSTSGHSPRYPNRSDREPGNRFELLSGIVKRWFVECGQYLRLT